MIDPYKMVFVNVIASCLVLLGIITYKFIYPKKKINLFILFLFISVLPIISIFRAGDYESGDFNIHIYRIMAFYDSLLEGHFMPSWAKDLNATYGYPLFIFNYSLPYYVISFLHWIGFSFISSMKLYLGLNLYLSGIFMFIFIKKLTNNNLTAFTSAIFYLFNPYHLIDIHFRATLGESTIFTLVPLQFFFITKYFKERKIISLVPISLFTGFLFLVHPLLASVFFVTEAIFILFVTIITKKIIPLIFSSGALIIGAFSSLYAWIPFFLYSPYMFREAMPIEQSDPSFYPFNQIIFSPWRYGLLFQGPNGELALIIGYAQISIIIVSIIMIIVKKVPNKILANYAFWIILCLFFIFLMHPISGIIWKHIYTFGGILTIYGRLSLAISFCTSVIVAYFTLALLSIKTSKIYLYILLIFAIGSTILNWGHRRVIPEINDNVLRANLWRSTSEAEAHFYANSKWVDIKNPWFSNFQKQHLEIIQGKGAVKEIKRTSTQHNYLVYAQTTVVVRENTLYYPGWSLKSNYNNISIYPGERGIINAKLPSGIQYIELSYEDIFPYKIAKIISVSIFAILIISLIYTLLLKRLTV